MEKNYNTCCSCEGSECVFASLINKLDDNPCNIILRNMYMDLKSKCRKEHHDNVVMTTNNLIKEEEIYGTSN